MKKLRLALIGAGKNGEIHAMILKGREDVEIVGVCDRDMEKAHKLAMNFEIPNVYCKHRRMLEELDFDVAVIMTPDHVCGEIVVDCAEAGKDIVTERTLATNYEDLGAIVDAIEKSKTRVMTDLYDRWTEPFVMTKRLVESGELGEIGSACFRLNERIAIPGSESPRDDRSSILWSTGCYSIDALRWVMGCEIRRVYSLSRSSNSKKRGSNTANVYQTMLEFDNGAIATMENGWITSGAYPRQNDLAFNISGSSGTVNIGLNEYLSMETVTIHDSKSDVLIKRFDCADHSNVISEGVNHFIDRLLSGESFLVSLADTVNVSLVVLAIMESARTGLPLNINY